MMNAMLVLVHTRYTASLLGELSREDSGINECFALHLRQPAHDIMSQAAIAASWDCGGALRLEQV